MYEAKLALAQFKQTLKRAQEARDRRTLTWHKHWQPKDDEPVVTRRQFKAAPKDTIEQSRKRLQEFKHAHNASTQKMHEVMEQIAITNRRPASWEIQTEEQKQQERRNEIKLAELQEEWYTIASSDKEQLHGMSRQMDMRS